MEDKLAIDGHALSYLSSFPKIKIADSFVKRANKIGTASGEAKLYIGPDSDELWEFFGPPNFDINCFVLKTNLLNFHYSLKNEYFSPSQSYRYSRPEAFKKFWEIRESVISTYNNLIEFKSYEQSQIKGSRIYIKSEASIFNFIREICLPNLTELIIDKYVNSFGHFFYCFRLLAVKH